MHNLVKISLAAALCTIICACSSGATVSVTDKSYSTETVKVNAQIPKISGLTDKEFAESINGEYNEKISGMLSKFEEEAKQTAGMSEFDTHTTEYYNKNGFLSMVTQIDYSAKKTQKSTARITKNINLSACEELSFGDLFEEDGYIDVINALLAEETANNPDKYADLWQKPRIAQNQDFYIDGERLVLYYPPYELSYYERGFVEIPVNLEDVSTCLKEEYRNIFMKNRE